MFVFKLKAMSYKDVKEAFHVTMGLDPVTEKISSDVELLDSYFSCKILLLFLQFQNLPQGTCGDNAVLNKRAKRSSSGINPKRRMKRETTGLSDLEVEVKSYGHSLRYECGMARKFLDEAGMNILFKN